MSYVPEEVLLADTALRRAQIQQLRQGWTCACRWDGEVVWVRVRLF